jgi:two-component system, OmpR family, sensor histidine kinase VicK
MPPISSFNRVFNYFSIIHLCHLIIFCKFLAIQKYSLEHLSIVLYTSILHNYLTNNTQNTKTEIYYGVDNVINAELQFFLKAKIKIDTCVNYTRPPLAILIEPIKKAFLDAKSRDVKFRCVTEITKDTIAYCKELITIVDDLRHLDGIKGNFMISETEYLAPVILYEKGKIASQVIYSNAKEIVEQQQYVFDTIWSKAIPAEQKIREIEEGIEPSNIEIIQNSRESIDLAYNMIKSAKEEVLRIFPSINSFRQQVQIDIMHLYREAVERGVRVRILIPAAALEIKQLINDVNLGFPYIDIRSIDESLHARIGIMVVDRKESLIIETNDDAKDNSYNVIGIASYSNSKPIALSYTSLFESLWLQTELYEQLKIHDKMQKFINESAHALHTHIQLIRGSATVLRFRKETIKGQEDLSLDMIIGGSKKLQMLTDEILDVTRIERPYITKQKKQQFNLNQLISDIVEHTNQISNDNIRLIYKSEKANDDDNNSIFVEADKSRLTQVISNLLDNAIKFTREGTISITTAEQKDNQVLVSIKDTGTGIDPQILPRLFTKFSSNSSKGTGLGLFISKSIIEAHGGKIWAQNNSDGKGATFSFILPIN